MYFLTTAVISIPSFYFSVSHTRTHTRTHTPRTHTSNTHNADTHTHKQAHAHTRTQTRNYPTHTHTHWHTNTPVTHKHTHRKQTEYLSWSAAIYVLMAALCSFIESHATCPFASQFSCSPACPLPPPNKLPLSEHWPPLGRV